MNPMSSVLEATSSYAMSGGPLPAMLAIAAPALFVWIITREGGLFMVITAMVGAGGFALAMLVATMMGLPEAWQWVSGLGGGLAALSCWRRAMTA